MNGSHPALMFLRFHPNIGSHLNKDPVIALL
jgi:hypothetical protein